MKIHFTENYDAHKTASIYVFKNKPSILRAVFEEILEFVGFYGTIKPYQEIKEVENMKIKPREILVTCFKKTQIDYRYSFLEGRLDFNGIPMSIATERKRMIDKGYGAGDIYTQVIG